MQIRQGDVLLVPINEIPATAEPVKRDNGRVILAYGEVTGHCHAIVEPTTVKLSEGIAEYLSVPQSATLTHEEHRSLNIPAGHYRLVHQREYTPQEIKRVLD